MEYGLADEPNEPQLAFHRLQAKLPKRVEALRGDTTEVGTLQALLDTKTKSSTSSLTLGREFVRLRHSYGRL